MKKNNAFYLLLILTLTLIVSCKKKNTFFSDKFGLGAEKTKPEDVLGLTEQLDFNVGTLPSSASLNMPPIGNQGTQGSCVSWAVTYGMLSYHRNLVTSTGYNNNTLMSPAFTYNQITQGNCTGTSIPYTMSLVCNKGSVSLSSMAYTQNSCSLQPTSTQFSSALGNKMTSYKWVNTRNVNRLKTCIVAGKPICIAMDCYTSFDNLKSPFVLTSLTGTSRGGHAMVIVGYDNAKNAFKVQNSWGSGWADGGYFWIDYTLVQNSGLDLWGFIFI